MREGELRYTIYAQHLIHITPMILIQMKVLRRFSAGLKIHANPQTASHHQHSTVQQ